MSNDIAPERIYLQVGADCTADDLTDVDWSSGEVTWSSERIYESDIEYIRADKATVQDDAREAAKGGGVMEPEMEAAIRSLLDAIADGAGPYDRDPLTHADNCIEQAKHLALRGLAALDANDPDIITDTLEKL